MFKKLLLKSKRPFYWIVLFGFIIYFRSLFFSYTYLDDNVLILENLFFLKNIGNLFKAFTQEVFHILHASAAYYRPMLTISFMLDAQVAGESPFFYHFSSIVIHLFNSCLVYILLKKFNFSKALSFIFAMVFCVHPVLTQAVVWVPGRNDSLLALFLLPSFIFLIDYIQFKKGKYLFWHLVFFALSLFTKESAVFIPFVILLYLFLFEERNVFLRKLPVVFTGWIFLGLIWFYLRSLALVNSPTPYALESALSTIVNNSLAIVLYIGKVIFPVNLSVLPIIEDSNLAFGVVAIVLLLIALLVSKKKNLKFILFGLVWFLIFLLPSFIRPSSVYVADFIEHRVYVPLIGLIMIIGQIDFVKNISLKKRWHFTLFIIIIVTLSTATTIYSGNFKDRLSFWLNAAKNSPHHPLAHKNLGAMYYLDGQFDNARVEFEKAVELNPTEPMIHNNLGLIYYQKGDNKKAEEEYKKELELYPNYDNAFMNLGLLYYRQNKKELAEKMWLKAVEINPDHKEALKSLTIYYSEIKDNLKVNYYYQEALKRGVKF